MTHPATTEAPVETRQQFNDRVRASLLLPDKPEDRKGVYPRRHAIAAVTATTHRQHVPSERRTP